MDRITELNKMADECRARKEDAKEQNVLIAAWLYGKYENVCRKKIMKLAMKEING